MTKQFLSMLLILLFIFGCQQKTKQYTGEQVWIGRYDHPNTTYYTMYTFIYNNSKPPKMKIETYNNNEIKKTTTKELVIVGQEKQYIILVPVDIVNRSDYNVVKDSLKFSIDTENQAKITSYDEKLVIPMKRK